MKACVCIVLFAAAAALAAPEGKREKRGYLHSGYTLGSFDDFHGYGLGDYEYGHSGSYVEHAPVYHAPVTKIVSHHKVVEVPKLVHVKKVVSVPKIVSVPKFVSVPKIVKVSKIVEEPHYYSSPSVSHGWW